MSWATDIPDVVAGQPITSAWGNLIRDRVVHNVATVAALPSTGIDDGEVAYVAADGLLYVRHSGRWRVRKLVSLAKTTDTSGMVVVTAAELGMVTILAGVANAAVTDAATNIGWSASRSSSAQITMFVYRSAGGVPFQVTKPSSASAVTVLVDVDGYVT